MSDASQKWNEEQVLEAFAQFHNSSSATSPKEQEERLKGCLKEIGKDEFGVDDIRNIVDQFVPPHCANQLTMAIVGRLQETEEV